MSTTTYLAALRRQVAGTTESAEEASHAKLAAELKVLTHTISQASKLAAELTAQQNKTDIEAEAVCHLQQHLTTHKVKISAARFSALLTAHGVLVRTRNPNYTPGLKSAKTQQAISNDHLAFGVNQPTTDSRASRPMFYKSTFAELLTLLNKPIFG